MMGALAYTLAGTDAWKLIAALNPTETGNDQRLLRRLAPFLIAGLQAPLPDLTRADPAVALVRSRQARGRVGRRTNRADPAVIPVKARPARRVEFGDDQPHDLGSGYSLRSRRSPRSSRTPAAAARARQQPRARARSARCMPPMSQTEPEAINAGTVWWDGDLFSGKPDWAKLLAFPQPTLSAEEQAFLDGETEELCRMAHDWDTYVLNDLPPHVWQFIKDKGFLGMIIPKEYGGKGFSAYAHSQVVTKLSTRCSAAAVTVMVPNSLGPAELLLHYGTEEQKHHYLPRLAKGLEIPCFALTNPDAGSDAARDSGLRHRLQGHVGGHARSLGMRVTWEKRYITLGPVATLLGLAFRLYDPDAPARRRGGRRHHLRAHPDRDAGREHRPAPLPAERRVPERPELGQGRLHAARLDHRRAEDGRPGLADADGVPRGGPLDLAAVLHRRHGEARGARAPAPTRACAASSARRSGKLRGRRGGAHAHRRQHST